jgi:hypothetical protein
MEKFKYNGKQRKWNIKYVKDNENYINSTCLLALELMLFLFLYSSNFWIFMVKLFSFSFIKRKNKLKTIFLFFVVNFQRFLWFLGGGTGFWLLFNFQWLPKVIGWLYGYAYMKTRTQTLSHQLQNNDEDKSYIYIQNLRPVARGFGSFVIKMAQLCTFASTASASSLTSLPTHHQSLFFPLSEGLCCILAPMSFWLSPSCHLCFFLIVLKSISWEQDSPS